MPVYEKVSIDDLHDLLAVVDRDAQVAVSENLHNLMAYCIVLLYEYCVCISYMRVNDVTVMNKAKATISTVKFALYDSNESLRSFLNVFRDTRDILCHMTAQAKRRQAVRNLLSTSVFYSTLDYFDIPLSIITSIREYYAKNFITNFNPFDYIRQKVGDKVNLLPVTAVCNCKTPEDCQDLIDSLAHLL